MEESYWTRSRSTRRGFLRALGMTAGALTLAPAIAACRSSAKHGSAGGAASSQAASRPSTGGTLTSSLPNDISNLDYAFATDVFSYAVIVNCVESLLTVDAQSQPTGLLATSWENPDDHTYVFKLRQGVKFQDGTDFNADAVEYSLNRIRTNKASSSYPQVVSVDKIEKPDQGTVKMTLSGPYAPFLYNLASNAGRVISPAIGEKYGKDRLQLDLAGQGTGPFKYVERKSGDHVTLVRDESYWGKDVTGTQLPYLDKLVYRIIPDSNAALAALRNGELDALNLGIGVNASPKDIASVKVDSSLSYQERPSNVVHYVAFNEAKEPFGSRELRQAVSYAIDRSAITKVVFFDHASPLDVIFTPSIWTYDADYHPYLKRDLGKARQLLAQAGKPNGFAFTLMLQSGASVFQQTAELIKDQLKEAGIEMTIQLLEVAALRAAMRAGEHQAGSVGVGGGLDPDSWVYPHFGTKGAQNSATHYSNPEVDRLLEQARTTLDTAGRKPLYQQAQRLIMTDAAFCMLWADTAVALSSKKVHNLPLGPLPVMDASQVWKAG